MHKHKPSFWKFILTFTSIDQNGKRNKICVCRQCNEKICIAEKSRKIYCIISSILVSICILFAPFSIMAVRRANDNFSISLKMVLAIAGIYCAAMIVAILIWDVIAYFVMSFELCDDKKKNDDA